MGKLDKTDEVDKSRRRVERGKRVARMRNSWPRLLRDVSTLLARAAFAYPSLGA